MSDSWTLRHARRDDYARVEELHREIHGADALPPHDVWAAELLPDTRLLEGGGRSVGFVTTKLAAGVAYIRLVAVEPARRGQGVGRALVTALGAELLGAGCARARFHIRADNVAARHLAGVMGAREEFRSTVLSLSMTERERWPRGATDGADLSVRAVRPEEDDEVESRFKLIPGRLAAARVRGAGALLLLVDRTRPDETGLGLACFDADARTVFPLHVESPPLAWRLLEAIRRRAPADTAPLRILVRSAPLLGQELVSAGARLVEELVHLSVDVSP